MYALQSFINPRFLSIDFYVRLPNYKYISKAKYFPCSARLLKIGRGLSFNIEYDITKILVSINLTGCVSSCCLWSEGQKVAEEIILPGGLLGFLGVSKEGELVILVN